MKLTDVEMTALLGLISRGDHDQLIRVNQQIRATLDVRARQATHQFRVGAKVKWNGKYGNQTGEVEHVKQKYVLVRITEGLQKGMRMNVPGSMLTVIQ